MSRTPHAARKFVEQVKDMRKSAKFEHHNEDGFGTLRSVTFDKPTSKWLAPILDEFDDERISGISNQGGKVTVTFTHRPPGESAESFPLEAAKTVADSRD